MNLTPLISFLKIVSLLGLIITSCLMTAVSYRKLEAYYPDQVKKYKWVFILVASLLSFQMFFIYQKFISHY